MWMLIGYILVPRKYGLNLWGMKYEIQVIHWLHMCQLLGNYCPLLYLPRMVYLTPLKIVTGIFD